MPVALFSCVMGIVGLGLAWRVAALTWGLPTFVGEAILAVGTCVYITLLACYGVKLWRHTRAAVAEFLHPETVNFFPTFSIGTMLMGSAALPHAPALAYALWSAGAALTLALSFVIVRRWITQGYELRQVSPTWFLAVVGNIVAPIAGVPMGHTELSWMFFGIGILFWVPLFTIVLLRLIFHGPLPSHLRPTMVILIGPPAIGFTAYVGLLGEVDAFARVLFYGAVFVALLLASTGRAFVGPRFSASCWAFTFPLDALALACSHYQLHSGRDAFGIAALVVLALATVAVLAVSVLTVRGLLRGTLWPPSSETLA